MNLFLLIFFQTTFFLFGFWFGVKAFFKNQNIDFDRAYTASKPFMMLSATLLALFVVGAITVRFDTILQKMPLIYQKYSILYIWSLMLGFIALVSGFIVALGLKLKRKLSSFLPSILLLNTLFLIFYFRVNGYIGDLVKESKRLDGGFLQTTNYTCTSASIATVATHFGIDIDEKIASKLTRVTKFGADLGQIRYALNQLGIGYETLNGKYKHLKDVKPPAIIFIDHPAIGKDGHAVVYFGFKGGKFEIFDPLKGRKKVSKEEISKIWNGNGIRCFKQKQ